MRVLILHSDVPADAPPDEQDTIVVSRGIADALRTGGHTVALAPFSISPERVHMLIRDAQADIVFNMVESVLGQDDLAVTAPAIFERLGIPFTGSSAATIALAASKPQAKRVLRAAGLATPDWAEPPHWHGLSADVSFIVKAASDDASRGLDTGAVVRGREAVAARAAHCARQFGGRWFAERYVEGREFNVAVVEENGAPRVLPIPEMTFNDWPQNTPRIVSYDAKWFEDSADGVRTSRAFGIEEEAPSLASAMADLARRAWHLFGLRGYVRIDMRVDIRGRPTILEINPNPCLDRDVGFAVASAQAGFGYEAALGLILAAAFDR